MCIYIVFAFESFKKIIFSAIASLEMADFKKSRIFNSRKMKVNITSSIDISPDEAYFGIVNRRRAETSSMYDYHLETFNLSSF